MVPKEMDPDRLAVLYVQQWLAEQGYKEALAALEQNAGILYDDTKLDQGSQLMQLIWGDVEKSMAEDVSDIIAARRKQEEQEWRQSGVGSYATKQARAITDSHTSNIITVRIWPGRDMLVTGAGDSHVRLLGFDGVVHWCSPVGGGGVLSVELGGGASDADLPCVACGSMDGSVSVLDSSTGALLCVVRPHTKYCVKVLWGAHAAAAIATQGTAAGLAAAAVSCSSSILSASWDHSVALHGLRCASGEWAMETLRKVEFPGAVQDISLLLSTDTLAVAVRDTNYLHLLEASTLEERRPANMNDHDDAHVSFWARHLALSPDGHHMLVTTDGTRLILLRTHDWTRARTYHGLHTEAFQARVAAWHGDGRHIYATGPGGQVAVYHVGSAKLMHTLHAHTGAVRDIVFDMEREQLVTCGYDKAVRFFST